MNNIKEVLKEWGKIVFYWLTGLAILLSCLQWIIRKEVTASEQRIKTEIALIDQSIKTIKENDLKHITDDIKGLNNRFDKMNERFDKLYQILLKRK